MWYILIMLFGGTFGACFIKNMLTTVIEVYKTHGMNLDSDVYFMGICGGFLGIICIGAAVIGALCLLETLIHKVHH